MKDDPLVSHSLYLLVGEVVDLLLGSTESRFGFGLRANHLLLHLSHTLLGSNRRLVNNLGEVGNGNLALGGCFGKLLGRLDDIVVDGIEVPDDHIHDGALLGLHIDDALILWVHLVEYRRDDAHVVFDYVLVEIVLKVGLKLTKRGCVIHLGPTLRIRVLRR